MRGLSLSIEVLRYQTARVAFAETLEHLGRVSSLLSDTADTLSNSAEPWVLVDLDNAIVFGAGWPTTEDIRTLVGRVREEHAAMDSLWNAIPSPERRNLEEPPALGKVGRLRPLV